ncbi:MAG: thioredoxin [bacterium]
MTEINAENFETEVLDSPLPVLVDFWAVWCGPCQMIGPIVEELAADYAGKLKVVKVNVDENQALAARYQVMSIPTLLLFENGKTVKQMMGYQPKENLVASLASYIS